MPEEKFDWKRLLKRLAPAPPPYPPLPQALFEGFEHHSVWIAEEEVDSSLEAMKERRKAEWRRWGYSESLIGMAEDLADEWISSMARAFAPGMPEVQKAIVRANYAKALDVANRWIRRIGEAAKAPV